MTGSVDQTTALPNMAATVTNNRMNRFFSSTEGPISLQSDDIVDELPKKRTSFSRVRKLSKRLSATFKSSLSLREEDISETDQSVTSFPSQTLDRSFPQKKKSGKTGLSRVLSLQVFQDHHDFKDTNVRGQEEMPNKHAYSTCDLSSTNSHEGLRRVLSVPAATGTGTVRTASPYGKLEHYTKLEQLGEGSYATVYKGISKINNIFVALKEIRLQQEEGIPFTAIREASLLKDLKHANIVRLHDIIPAKEHLVLVFEYLNTDLCMFLEERPFGLRPYNTKLLLFQLLRGLRFIHRKQILHRDIKPQNVLLSNRGELKLADFGLARAKSVPSNTYTHEIVTLWYRPPDVLLGSTHYTTSLDIWGVGCIFVEMISGFPLFPGVKSARDQLSKIFKVCGTPAASLWPNEVNGYSREDFYNYPKIPLSHQAPRLKAIEHAEDFAERMLQFEPRDRVSAANGMKDKYFDELPKAIHTLPPTTSIFVIPSLRMAEDHRRPESAKARSMKSFGHFV